MMKYWLNTALFLCFTAANLQAQDFDNYQPIKNNGLLPTDFLMSWSESYNKDVAQISRKDARSLKSDKKDFYKKADYSLNELVRSGLVVMEDTYTDYIRKVMNLVLKNKPELQKKVRIYLVRTPVVNAFATNQGIVFITYGLLAQIENEAQLAFILAHEVSHIEKEHAINFHVKAQKIDRASNSWYSQNSSYGESVITKSRFSKENENEADALGWDLFQVSSYNSEKLSHVFDVLRYAYLPFDEEPFDYSVLESEDLKLLESFKLDQVKAIKSVAEKEDEEKKTEETSTHPNLSTRKATIEGKITKVSNDKKSDYLVSEAYFLKMQEIMRFELSAIYVKNQAYNDAIYNSFLLLKKYPKSIYLKKNIAKSLYFISKYANDESVDYDREKTEDVEGESQRVYNIFEKMSLKELNILALNYLLHLEKEYPKDLELNKMVDDLLFELPYHHDLYLANFKEAPNSGQYVKTAEPKKEVSNNKLDKIYKITQNNEKSEWYAYALSSFIGDKAFKKRFEEIEEKANSKKEKKDEDEKAKIRAMWMRPKPQKLGVNKIVIVNPFYLAADQSILGAGLKYNETEDGEKRLNKYLTDMAARANVKTVILNKCSLKAGDVDQFNDLVELNDWFEEQSNSKSMTIVASKQAQIEALAQKYGTDYFVWSGVINLKKPNQFIGLNLWLIPLQIYHGFKGTFSTFYYTVLYNVKTGKNVILKSQWVDADDSYAVTSSQLYDALLQIKTK